MAHRYRLVSVLFAAYFIFAIASAQDSGDGAQGQDSQGEGEDPTDMLREVHGILASIAWVILFPVGSIMMRLIKGSNAWWIHASIQSTAVLLVTASAASGIVLATKEGELDEYHPIIGLVLFSVIFFQAAGGIVHHMLYRKKARRTIVSHVHIWFGRTIITLGIINGGLGLQLSGEGAGKIAAYSVVAALFCLGYIVYAVVGHRKK